MNTAISIVSPANTELLLPVTKSSFTIYHCIICFEVERSKAPMSSVVYPEILSIVRPLVNTTVLVPSPTSIVSAPSPPVIESFPLLPLKTSPIPPPLIVSDPEPPEYVTL